MNLIIISFEIRLLTKVQILFGAIIIIIVR